jgi:hypothetical protein
VGRNLIQASFYGTDESQPRGFAYMSTLGRGPAVMGANAMSANSGDSDAGEASMPFGNTANIVQSSHNDWLPQLGDASRLRWAQNFHFLNHPPLSNWC